MTSFKPKWAFLAACLCLPGIGAAADDAAALRAELQALKDDYAARVGAIEARLERLESPAPSVAPPVPEAAAPTTRSANAAAAFNPAISVILGGHYTNTSQDPESWRIAGFMPSGGEVGPGERSFNLGESELTITANVDHYFSANLTAAIAGEDEIHVEEAFFRTLALPSGFTAKGGRFFSGFGYLNEVHAHAWDFVDQPLVYQALFGGQQAQDGIQVKWLAPIDLFLEFGAETGNGQNFPGTRRNRNGSNGLTLFTHVGGDIGDSTSWRVGAAWLEQKAEDRAYDDIDEFGDAVQNTFTGRSRTWIVDATLKWAPSGNSARRQLKLQGEYMRRRENGELNFDALGLQLSDAYRGNPSGWYVQSVYQFLPHWRAGMRYDALDSGTTALGVVRNGALPRTAFPLLLGASPTRLTTMFDWNPSEFTRLRLQYSWDDARDEGSRDRQWQLQYLYGIGAHGAHKY